MLRLGVLVSVFCLCFSSYSLAYDQQYQIGSTGPNGGIVTSVTVDTVLMDTSTAQVGDYEEKTYTYKYTESVTEDVTSTAQITITTYETVETSTGNILLGNTNKTSSGGVLDHSSTSTNSTGHIHTDYRGGQITYTNELKDYLTVDEINNGFSVNASADVYACTNQIGGHCSSGTLDTFRITLKVIDPETGLQTESTSSWLVNYSNQTYSMSMDVPTNVYGANTQLLSTFYGIDNGNWAGWYGPLIQNMAVSIQFDQMTAVLTTIEQTIINTIQSALDTIESEMTKTYKPIVIPGTEQLTVMPTQEIKIEEPKVVEIKMETPGANPVQIEVKVETNDAGNVEVSMSSNMEAPKTIAEIKPMSSPSGGSTEAKVEIKMPAGKSESKSDNKSSNNKDEKKEDNKGETKTTTVAEAKQKVANQIMLQVMAQADAILINDTKIALMTALADTENFAKYQARKNQDLQDWYNDQGIYNNQKDLPDPYSVVFSLAQDKLMEKMENQQYDSDFGKGFAIDN